MSYGHVGIKEDLKLIGIGDASYKMSEKAVGGTVFMLAGKDLMKASPIQWKSKQIEGVCKSSNDIKNTTMILTIPC